MAGVNGRIVPGRETPLYELPWHSVARRTGPIARLNWLSGPHTLGIMEHAGGASVIGIDFGPRSGVGRDPAQLHEPARRRNKRLISFPVRKHEAGDDAIGLSHRADIGLTSA